MKKLFFVICLISISVFMFAYDTTTVQSNVEKFGFWTLLPPLIAITLCFITRNVVLSLALGVFAGTFLLELNNLNIFRILFKSFLLFIQKIRGSVATPWSAGIILQCLTIGGMIALISKTGGVKAIAENLSKKAKTPQSAQLVTWLLGLIVFFDDYANALIVGPIMRPVTDKVKISREKLSFIVDATAAPIAGMAFISTWIGYELSLIKDAYSSIGQNVNPYATFISTIPYRFYNILILGFIFFSAWLLKDFGPMLKAEQRARKTGKVSRDGAKPLISDEINKLEPKANVQLNMWNAIIPILVLLISTFCGFYYNGYKSIMNGQNIDLIVLLKTAPFSLTSLRETFGAADVSVVLFQSALLAGIVAMCMGISQKIFTLGEAVEIWIQGMKALLITAIILVLAWSLSSVVKDLGTAKYLVSILSDKIPKFTLPAIIFFLGSIISFATGTSYGTMGILMPLTIPLAYAISSEPGYIIMNISAVLTGAIFGDHCSPISDTTILSSMGSSCDHIDHTNTQLVYALVIAVITILFGYLPTGFGLPVIIVLPVAIIITALLVVFVGHRVEE